MKHYGPVVRTLFHIAVMLMMAASARSADGCVGITNQPLNRTFPERGLAYFSLTATGTPQNIQWYRSNNGGASYAPIPGAISNSYSIASVVYPGDNGARFRATVSNSLCLITSTVAILTVIPDSIPPTVVSASAGLTLDTVIINFSEELLPSGAVEPRNFILWPKGADPDQDYYLTTGAVLNHGTNVVITTDPRVGGPTNYSLRIQEIRDASSSQNVIDPNPTDIPAIRQQFSLVEFTGANSIWKFSDQTNLFGTGWETTGYDDATANWFPGSGGLGFDNASNGVPVNTVTFYAAHSEPTFFRRHFTLPGFTIPFFNNGLVLSMRHVFEDGAVVYLNGQEAGRFNVAAGAALVDGVRSMAAAPDPTPISGLLALPTTNVFPGDNVIAVVVVQSGAASPDIELAVELIAELPEYATGPAVITAQPAASTTVNEGQGFSLSVGAYGAVPFTFQWRKGGVPIPGANGVTFGVAAASPSDAGTYTVAVSNNYGGVISSVAQVVIHPNLHISRDVATGTVRIE